MPTNTASPVAIQRGLTTAFRLAVEAATPFYPDLCTIVQSQGADEKYGFLGAMPGMREWLGPRQFQSLAGADYTLANKDWESSIEIEKKDVEDDRVGVYGTPLQMLGEEAACHPDELLLTCIVAGESTACYDGQYFFDTDHAMGESGSQSNDLTATAATGTTPTEAEFRTAYHAARAAMLGFKNDKGKFFIRPTVRPFSKLMLLVPAVLEEVANQAINKTFVSSGETNIVLDKPAIVACGGLTDATKFYLLNLSQPLKPFVYQSRSKIQTQMTGYESIEHRVLKFMASARYNLGYLAWWNAVLTTWT